MAIDYNNLARLYWQYSGLGDEQRKMYGDSDIGRFGGNLTGIVKKAQDFERLGYDGFYNQLLNELTPYFRENLRGAYGDEAKAALGLPSTATPDEVAIASARRTADNLQRGFIDTQRGITPEAPKGTPLSTEQLYQIRQRQGSGDTRPIEEIIKEVTVKPASTPPVSSSSGVNTPPTGGSTPSAGGNTSTGTGGTGGGSGSSAGGGSTSSMGNSVGGGNVDQVLFNILASRPDLQQLYGSDGKAINPNDPRVKGIPTISDWARTYGTKEYPTLKEAFSIKKPLGIPDEIWAQASEEQKAVIAGMNDVIQKQLDANQQIPIRLTPEELQKLYKEAQTDPVISKYYGDRLRMGEADLQHTLGIIGGAYNQEEQAKLRQFERDKKNLALAEADAGRAFSGFREQAKDTMAKSQSDIISSSRRQLKDTLYNLGSQFERTYGTKYTPGLNISTEGYSKLGDISGSEASGRLADTENKYQSLISDTLLKRGALQ